MSPLSPLPHAPDLGVYTYSIKVVDNPDFAILIVQVVLDVVAVQVHADIFLHVFAVFLLELVRML